MKAMTLAIFCLMFLPAVFTACKKETAEAPPTPTDSIEGKWSGKYGFENEAPSVEYRFNIKPGGIIEELNSGGLAKGSGTWNLTGTLFTAHYKWKSPLNTVFSVKAAFDKINGKLSGTWGYDDSETDGGKWSMTKEN